MMRLQNGWLSPLPLDRSQDHVGLCAGDGGDAEQHAFQKIVIRLDIGADDMQVIVGLPCRGIAGADFGAALDGADESVKLVRIVACQVDMHDGPKAEALFFIVQQHGILADDAAFLERLDPAPAGRGRQPCPIGEIGVRDAAIFPQGVENALIAWVKFRHN